MQVSRHILSTKRTGGKKIGVIDYETIKATLLSFKVEKCVLKLTMHLECIPNYIISTGITYLIQLYNNNSLNLTHKTLTRINLCIFLTIQNY